MLQAALPMCCECWQDSALVVVEFEAENASNVAPVQAVFRLDAGFATWDNVALLIELGYEVYSRPYNQKVKAALLRRTSPATTWTHVGDNAEMIAWPHPQMHHLKVRSAPALWMQEQSTAFAANFVRWAAQWLSR